MVEATIRSVLDQDWPAERLLIIVGDDAANPDLAARLTELASHTPARIVYHRPFPLGSPERGNVAKAGNLNSAMKELERLDPLDQIHFVETRDADDLVGDREFLRRAVAHLTDAPRAAFVQTIKRATVSRGDPFGNVEPTFYERVMISRHASNAVFPCGSGLVWRREALGDIGGFPTWGLVEDLQSGVEALRRGWRGIYLPIVGAIAQHAPEDLPNVYKQRGTWAWDTVRLLCWGDLSGLSFRQRLQFLELGLFYAQGLVFVVLCIYPIIGLATATYPLETTQLEFALHFWPCAIAIELFLVALSNGLPLESVWRSRQMSTGLAFVHAAACVRAVFGGPSSKPTYRVTRKVHEHDVYLRLVAPHIAVCVGFVIALGIALARDNPLTELDLGSVYWGAVMSMVMATFATKSWFGAAGRSADAMQRESTRQAVLGSMLRSMEVNSPSS